MLAHRQAQSKLGDVKKLPGNSVARQVEDHNLAAGEKGRQQHRHEQRRPAERGAADDIDPAIPRTSPDELQARYRVPATLLGVDPLALALPGCGRRGVELGDSPILGLGPGGRFRMLRRVGVLLAKAETARHPPVADDRLRLDGRQGWRRRRQPRAFPPNGHRAADREAVAHRHD
ncbi:MAG: hypothetical protein R2698_07720 [Microthrixaceae bacterium]